MREEMGGPPTSRLLMELLLRKPRPRAGLQPTGGWGEASAMKPGVRASAGPQLGWGLPALSGGSFLYRKG